MRITPTAELSGVKVRWDGKSCPSDCSPENVATCQEFSCLDYEAPGQVVYRYTCATSTRTNDGQLPEVTCAAFGDLDEDGQLGVFIYGTANTQRANNPNHELGIAGPLPEVVRTSCPPASKIPVGEVFYCSSKAY